MKQIDDSILEKLSEMLGSASAEKLDRVRLLIEKNNEVSQEVKDEFFAAIDAISPGEIEEATDSSDDNTDVPEDLVAALAVDGMSEYIASIQEEAYNKGAKDSTLEQADQEEIKEEKTSKEEVTEEEDSTEVKDSEEESSDEEERVRVVLVDSIVQNAVALRCSEINLEDIENSRKDYKSSLEGKTLSELKTIFRNLSKKMTETFVEAPTESLNNETLSEDKPKGLDSEEENEGAMSDARKVIRSYLKQN